jgi:hypothetical protein
MKTIEIKDLAYNPLLKELLIKYISRQYEEDGLFDEYHLLAEYNHLKNENSLHLLFEEEWFTSYMNDGKHYTG